MLASLGDLVEDVIVRLDGPVNVASDTHATISRRRGGSAANVVARAAALGHPARFLGRVGTDAIGTALIADLSADGVDASMVRRGGSTGTIVALVDHLGERSMLTDRGACLDLDDPDRSWLDGVSTLHVPFYSLATGPIATTASTVIDWAHERRRGGVDRRVVDGDHARGRHRRGAPAACRSAPDVVLANGDEAAALQIDGPVGRRAHRGQARTSVGSRPPHRRLDHRGAGDRCTRRERHHGCRRRVRCRLAHLRRLGRRPCRRMQRRPSGRRRAAQKPSRPVRSNASVGTSRPSGSSLTVMSSCIAMV